MEGKGMLKKISCLAIAGLMLLTGQALATDTRTTAINKIEQAEAGSLMVDKVLGYGSNYDLRKYQWLTITSPGGTNASWAIVATKLLEQNCDVKYSAKHMDYMTAANSTYEGNSANSYNRKLGDGGNMQIALGYMTSGNGMVLESSQNGMAWNGAFNKINQSTLEAYGKTGRLESYVKFPTMYKMTYDALDSKVTMAFNDKMIYEAPDAETAQQVIERNKSIESYKGGQIEQNRQAIKEHIIKYGMVSAQIYRDDNYMKAVGTTQRKATWVERAYDDEGSFEGYYTVNNEWEERYLLETPLYYYNVGNRTPNSDVIIIGWDDEVQVQGAPGKGAYIVLDPVQYFKSTYTILDGPYNSQEEAKNGGGWWYDDYTAVYEDGRWWRVVNKKIGSGRNDVVNSKYISKTYNFYYVSYYDYYIESNVYGIKSFSTSSAGKTYQYDKLGLSTAVTPDEAYAYAYGANVFARDTSVPERLDSISIANVEPMKYEIYVNPKNSNLTSSSFIKVAETGVLEAGYNTIYFDNSIMLTGKEFVVAVKYISTDSVARTPKVGVQSPIRRTYLIQGQGESATTTETTEKIPYWADSRLSLSAQGRSFVGRDLDHLTDLYQNSETKNMIVCIKAYTSESPGYKIPATSIEIQKLSDVGVYESLENNTIQILKGDQAYLGIKTNPEDSDYKEVSWTSSNRNIVSIDNTGTISAVGAGVVTLTARLKNAPAIYTTCTVDVRVPIDSFVLNKNNVTILAGETNVLAGIIGPEDATTTKINWESSNKQVVKVTEDGLLIGLNKGTAIVTATIKDENGLHTATCKVTVPETLIVDVLDVSLNKTSLTLQKGFRETLKATVTPADATNTAVVWTSSNKNVAIVNANGRITALSKGTAVITVTTVSGGETATCNVTVTEEEKVQPTGITLNRSTLTLEKDDTSQLVATVTPSNCEDTTVLWDSSDWNVIKVDLNGKITARDYGTAEVTATTSDGKYTAKCTVTVEKPVVKVTGITINKTALTLEKDATEQLLAGTQPATADNAKIIWSSSNENIVTVDQNGTITAVGYGDATITAKTEDGGYTKTCIVSVPQNIAVTGISLSKETLTIKKGRTADLKVYVLPADATNANYKFEIADDTVAIFGANSVKALKEGTTTITFTTEDGNYSKTCTVTVEALENTDIDISSDKYQIEEDKTITSVPSDTTKKDFIENIVTDGTTVVIKDKDGNILEDTDSIGTGSTIEISKEIETIPEGETDPVTETVTETFTVKITGDVNGDGKVSSTDLSIIKQYIMSETTLEGLYAEVADLNGDGEVTLTDLSMIKQQIISSENETEQGGQE